MEIRALVVDDSRIMRKLVIRSLTESKLAEFAFVEAGDGAEALRHFDPDATGMIFVDWNMPNMNGIELVRKVRSMEKRHVPIVMITTETTMGKVEEARDYAGVDCYIVKPFTTEVLQKKLQPLFDKMSKRGGFFSKLAARIA